MSRFYFESEVFLKAKEKFETCGDIGVTSADHKALYSTPPPRLADNPGKTLGQLMSDEEIATWIRDNEMVLNHYSSDEFKNSDFATSYMSSLSERFTAGKNYLKSIGRL